MGSGVGEVQSERGPRVRGGRAGQGTRGGTAAREDSGGVNAVDYPSTLRLPGTHAHQAPAGAALGDWCWPWGNPVTSHGSTSIFGSIAFAGVGFAYAGINKCQAIPMVIGARRLVKSIALSRRSSTGTSDESKIKVGIYADDGRGYPGQRLWAGEIVLFPTGSTVGVAFLEVTPNLTLEAGELYWFVFGPFKQEVVDISATIVGFPAYTLQPVLGLIYNETIALLHGINSTAPVGAHGWGHAFNFAALPETFPATAPVILSQTGGGINNVPAIFTALGAPF